MEKWMISLTSAEKAQDEPEISCHVGNKEIFRLIGTNQKNTQDRGSSGYIMIIMGYNTLNKVGVYVNITKFCHKLNFKVR